MKRFILLILISYSGWSISATEYKLEDLQALANSGTWAELVDHLHDVPPSERTQEWNSLAQQGLSARLKQLLGSGDTESAQLFLKTHFPRFPFLRDDTAFMQLRRDFGMRYYEYCFSYNDDTCHKELLGFVQADPDASLALDVARLVRLRASDLRAIEYFELALAKSSAKPQQVSVCEDENLRISLENALKAPSDSNYAKSAKSVAFGRCFEPLQGIIKSAIKDNTNAKSNACQQMLEKNALTGIAKKKCEAFLRG
ncbi:MAG: hypothetical protein OEY67_09290 [Gammaproteobacteria bacterium]|nr:hypothetical protein [Gammaproteobacteria bacterium]